MNDANCQKFEKEGGSSRREGSSRQLDLFFSSAFPVAKVKKKKANPSAQAKFRQNQRNIVTLQIKKKNNAFFLLLRKLTISYVTAYCLHLC